MNKLQRNNKLFCKFINFKNDYAELGHQKQLQIRKCMHINQRRKYTKESILTCLEENQAKFY